MAPVKRVETKRTRWWWLCCSHTDPVYGWRFYLRLGRCGIDAATGQWPRLRLWAGWHEIALHDKWSDFRSPHRTKLGGVLLSWGRAA